MELLGSDPESAVEYISESISYLPPNLPLYMHKYKLLWAYGYSLGSFGGYRVKGIHCLLDTTRNLP